jgi:hypothetical protein
LKMRQRVMALPMQTDLHRFLGAVRDCFFAGSTQLTSGLLAYVCLHSHPKMAPQSVGKNGYRKVICAGGPRGQNTLSKGCWCHCGHQRSVTHSCGVRLSGGGSKLTKGVCFETFSKSRQP